jgi:hypothetical protein
LLKANPLPEIPPAPFDNGGWGDFKGWLLNRFFLVYNSAVPYHLWLDFENICRLQRRRNGADYNKRFSGKWV